MLNILNRSKPTPTRAPNAKPVYSRPGRSVIVAKALALVDEQIKLFEREGRNVTGEPEQADVGRIVSLLKSKERDLQTERDLLVEAMVPDWHLDQHAREMTSLGAEIESEIAGARDAVLSFLGYENRVRDVRQAGSYALQLVDTPLRVWQRHFGGR